MNFIQQGIQNVIGWAFGIQSRDSYDEASGARMKALANLISYYDGKQRRPLRVSGLGKDYNVITNMVKTIVDRSVSMLFQVRANHRRMKSLPAYGTLTERTFYSTT